MSFIFLFYECFDCYVYFVNRLFSGLDQTYLYSDEKTLFSQGAEARLYKCIYLGRAAVMKERFVKTYRHPDLDKRLTKERIRNEFRTIVKCKQVCPLYTLNND